MSFRNLFDTNTAREKWTPLYNTWKYLGLISYGSHNNYWHFKQINIPSNIPAPLSFEVLSIFQPLCRLRFYQYSSPSVVWGSINIPAPLSFEVLSIFQPLCRLRFYQYSSPSVVWGSINIPAPLSFEVLSILRSERLGSLVTPVILVIVRKVSCSFLGSTLYERSSKWN